MLKQFREMEELIGKYHEVGIGQKLGVTQIKAARLKAEIELEKLKAQK